MKNGFTLLRHTNFLKKALKKPKNEKKRIFRYFFIKLRLEQDLKKRKNMIFRFFYHSKVLVGVDKTPKHSLFYAVK